jgi:hypothetical protein
MTVAPLTPYAKVVTATKAAGGPAASIAANSGNGSEKTVATPSDDNVRLKKLWKLPRALMQGTRGMRAAGARAVGNAQYTEWLPREPAETPAAYTARLFRSTLFNGFRKTVKDMTGKVFQREVTLEDDVPEQLVEIAENIDNAGRHLNVFARDVFFDGMQTGINYILVEMPPALKKEDGTPVTLAAEQAAKIRPYLCHIQAEDLIGFKSDVIDGVVTLTQARIRENATEPDGDFNETTIEQIRVLEPGKWQIWRKLDSAGGRKTWQLYQKGTTSLSYIPLVPVYINRTGFFIGEPPLEDLADLNVAHWQSSSDQRNILHVARVPILFGAGFGDDSKIEVGINSMVRNSDSNAKLEYVEHTGAAIDAGQTDLDKLEFQMQVQGLQLLVPQPGGQTATGEIRDEAKENSPLAMMATALGDALEQAFGYMADYLGIKADGDGDTDVDKAGGSVDVNTDFGVGTGTGIDLQLLLNATTANKISVETFWSEMKRRDILADSFDPEVEKSRIDSAAPDLGLNVPPGKGMNLDDPAPKFDSQTGKPIPPKIDPKTGKPVVTQKAPNAAAD